MKNYLIGLTLIFLGAFVSVYGQSFPKKENKLVYDGAGILSQQEIQYFENKLVQFEDSTSNELSLVIVNSLEDYDVSDYGQRLAETWGIGKSAKNNGVLLLIAPNERKLTIQTGYGLEGALPDAICKRIIELEIKPSFKSGNYAEGINNGIQAIFLATKGEYKADKKEKSAPIGLIIVIIVFLIFLFFSSKGGGSAIGSTNSSLPWWMLMSSGSPRRGSWGDFSGGKGSFGGFGGGSFGGGGASGSW